MLNFLFAGLLPLQGSDVAARWDELYLFLVGISIFFVILIVGGMIYFVIRYRHQNNPKTKYILGSHRLELLWTILPTVLLLVIFVWGFKVYRAMVQPPANAYEIRVLGRQWLWQFQYDDGRMTVGELFVPVNQPIKLVMSSEDVVHSFFIPNFRVKQDVVPGLYTTLWFEATVPGKHVIYCAEYCGTAHSGMLANLIVLKPEQWEAWKRGQKLADIPEAGGAKAGPPGGAGSLAEQGKKLSTLRGCVACHSDDGTPRVGPTFKGIYGHTVEFADGSSGVVNDAYIRESLENPQVKVVKGFGPVMPTFKGQLREEEINALIAYIKSVK